jgi:hypothetical protein
MDSRLLALVCEYQSAVAAAIELMVRSGIPLPLSKFDWATNGIPTSGFLEGGITYRKHGYGCEVLLHGACVDFDFGGSGEYEGLDLWRIESFSRDRLGKFGILSAEELRRLFSAAIEKGDFVRSGNGLYGLKKGVGVDVKVLPKAVRLTVITGLTVLAAILVGGVASRPKNTFVLTPLASFKDCPGLRPNESSGFSGDHAIVAEDGEAVSLQCSNGAVLTWQVGGATRKFEGRTLISVASTIGSVSPALQCSDQFAGETCGTKGGVAISGFPACRSSRFKSAEPPDCEVIDHPGGGSTYVMRNVGAQTSFVAATASSDILTLGSSERPGVLMPRSGRAKNLVYISNGTSLVSVSLATGRSATLATFPTSFTPWQNSESQGDQVAYSRANDLMIVSFGGSFVGSQVIAFVRAYTPAGLHKWSVNGNVTAGKNGFSGDLAEVHVFGGGRYATFNRISDRQSFDIIDLENGNILATFEGWPIAVASEADRMLVKKPNGDYSYLEMIQKNVSRWSHHAS